MSRRPSRGVLFLLLDAFRYDYLNRCRFLRTLATRSLTGRLQEPFGFLPRAAYFGGLTTGEFGYSHLCHYDPAGSPFRWTRHVLGEPAIARVLEQELRHALDAHTLDQLPPFVRAYASALQIPARYLPLFNFSEREAPWGKRPGYASLFDTLRDHGLGSFVCAWPENQTVHPRGDGALVQETLAGFDARHRFGFLHLSALDGLGHAYGPGSAEVDTALQDTDRWVEALFAHLDASFDEYALVIIGDHGMMRVLDQVDALGPLESAGLALGTEAAWFVDSTTVRAWVLDESKRTRLIRALESIPGGRLLDGNDWDRFELTGTRWANGELIVLADPGVVFAPNFFQGSSEAPRGMHGYAPDVADNQGIFLLYDSTRRDRGEAGVVEARQLFATLLDRCDLPVPEAHRAHVATAQRATRRAFTCSGSQMAEDTARDQLTLTATRITALDPQYRAIAVGGSFGRGEGVMRSTALGLSPVNDYDVIVMGSETPGQAFGELGRMLASELQTDFVDIGRWPRDLSMLPLSQATFDWRYGHQVLRGDPLAFEELPRMAPADIPFADAMRLLGNRACGLLLAEVHTFDQGTEWPHRAAALERPFGRGQVLKLAVALVDACVIAWQDYHVSSIVKRQRVADLWRTAGLQDGTAAVLDTAMRLKLGEAEVTGAILTFPCVQHALRDVLGLLATFVRSTPTVPRTDSSVEALDAANVRRCMDACGGRDPLAESLHEAALLLSLATDACDVRDPRVTAAVAVLPRELPDTDRRTLVSAIVDHWLPTIH